MVLASISLLSHPLRAVRHSPRALHVQSFGTVFPEVVRRCLAIACQGLATAPVLFASYTHPVLLEAMARKFEAVDDIARTCELVQATRGIERTRHLAFAHAQRALDALQGLPPSQYRTALAALTHAVIFRSK